MQNDPSALRRAQITESPLMDMSKISVGNNPPFDVNVIVEVPLGGEPIKYELDKDSGALFVDRFLYTAMRPVIMDLSRTHYPMMAIQQMSWLSVIAP